MSHLSKIKTKFKNIDTLKATLESMKCEVEVGNNLTCNMPMRMDGAKHEKVDLLVRKIPGARGGDFAGFRWNGGELEMIGDQWGTGINLGDFSRDITKEYAVNEVKTQFSQIPELQEFDLVNQEINDQGEVVITYQRW